MPKTTIKIGRPLPIKNTLTTACRGWSVRETATHHQSCSRYPPGFTQHALQGPLLREPTLNLWPHFETGLNITPPSRSRKIGGEEQHPLPCLFPWPSDAINSWAEGRVDGRLPFFTKFHGQSLGGNLSSVISVGIESTAFADAICCKNHWSSEPKGNLEPSRI